MDEELFYCGMCEKKYTRGNIQEGIGEVRIIYYQDDPQTVKEILQAQLIQCPNKHTIGAYHTEIDTDFPF